MKATSFAIVFALLMMVGHAAEAQRARPEGFHGERFEANKKFGLGLELGAPTGLTGKLFISPDNAIDFGIGDLYHNYYVDNGAGLHLYADYLWHPFVLTKAEAFYLPFYIGVGGRFWSFDYNCRGCTGASAFGIRVPIGISFDFNNVPLDIFLQLVPTLDFFRDYNGPGTHSVYLDVDFSFGARFWFS